jgi:hypothetical protein
MGASIFVFLSPLTAGNLIPVNVLYSDFPSRIGLVNSFGRAMQMRSFDVRLEPTHGFKNIAQLCLYLAYMGLGYQPARLYG